MSMSLEKYLGAFAILELNKILEKETFWICDGGHKRGNEEEKFCSKCGKMFIKKERTVETYSNYYDLVYEKYQDTFRPVFMEDHYYEGGDDEILILSNIVNDNIQIDIEDKIYTEIENNQDFYIDNFKKEYKKELEFLKNLRGVKNIQYKFGFVQWYG